MTQAQQSTAKGWMPDDSTFGARLALVRQRMRWGNVNEAASQCGIPTESWRTWERDNVVPRRLVEMSTLIANRTGCDLGWLIAGPQLAGLGGANDSSAPLRQSVMPTGVTSPFGQKPKGTRRTSSVGPAARRRPALIGPGIRAS